MNILSEKSLQRDLRQFLFYQLETDSSNNKTAQYSTVKHSTTEYAVQGCKDQAALGET